MRRVGGLIAALIALGALVGDVSATGDAMSVDFKYVGEVRASYTVVVTDSASALTGRNSTTVRYSTPMVVNVQGSKVSGYGAPSPGQRPVGTVAVAITGRDRAGCSFAFKKTLRAPMVLTASALDPGGSLRFPTRTVPGGYYLDLLVYPAGVLPKLTTTCNVDEAIGLVSLRAFLGAAIWLSKSGSAYAGAWPPAFSHVTWPFAPLVFREAWSATPTKRGGTYRLPAPVDKLAAGKPVTVTRNLALRRTFAAAEQGPGSVTVTTKGTLTFSFKPKR